MKKISLSLALVGTVAALPYPEDVGPPGSSYNVSSAMEVVNALADGKLARLFGNDNAQEQLENLARMFGAGPGKAGDMWLNLKDSMNRKDFVIIKRTLTYNHSSGLWKSLTCCR
jgi:hypothetical protein